MRTRTWLIASSGALLGAVVLLVASENREQEAVDRLARQRAPAEAVAPDDGPPAMFQLSSRLIAEPDDAGFTWSVHQIGKSTTIELPFPPRRDGNLPAAVAEIAAEQADSNPGFLGAAACADCHQDKHAGFVRTAHHRTSGTLTENLVRGDFSGPRSKLATGDPDLSFAMEHQGDRYFQRVWLADWSVAFPLDVFTGSAKAGQTFLYWHGDALFQSHVSYLGPLNEWVISPGYGDTLVDYTRPIRPGCLECHVTYIGLRQMPNVYDRDSAVWGISCERCHGPGREHVEFHRNNPEEKKSRHIVHPSSLTRPQQLSICGQCHSGSFALLGDAFSYRPGDDLDKYHQLFNPDFEGVGGIHTSNQLSRLRLSKCFQQSEMTCTHCHDPHQNQRGNLALFTKACLACHQPEQCGLSTRLGDRLAENCIDCHMPKGDTEGMTLQVSSGNFTVRMVDHFIRVDQRASEVYLDRAGTVKP